MEAKWGPIGREVFERTYSRTKPDGTKESFEETVRRMVRGNVQLVDPWCVDEGEEERLVELILQHKLVPAGRHWWVSGVPGRQFLFNCVAGETMVMTPDGDKPIEELAGLEESIELYVHNMYARPTVAPVQWYGRRNVVSVRLKSGGMEQVIRATPDHDWIKQDGTRVTTAELKKGDKLATTSTRNRFNTTTMSNIGVMAGFVYGDGSRTDQSARVRLCGEKDAEMLPWFAGCDIQYFPSTGSDAVIMGLPRSWKDAPSLDEGACYLKGWLAGHIAADGHVSEAGYVTIGSRSKESLEVVRKVATFLGIRTSTIRIHENSPGLAFNVRLERVSEDMLLLSHHRERYVEHLFEDWRVMDVIDNGEVTDVYCAYVENLHEFTLAGWLRTGNCHRAGWTDQLADHVGFVFDELMKGGGVGANYSHDYMQRMHRVRREVWVEFAIGGSHPDNGEVWPHQIDPETRSTLKDMTYQSLTVEDSREGWVHALETVCRLAQLEGRGVFLIVDLSLVRPRGSEIQGFGGTASGPGPLASMLSQVTRTLRGAVGRKLTGLECMDIDHAVASCVVAGNVRRSARMSMMHWSDPQVEEFIDLKRDGGHWTTNISVELDHDFWRLLDSGDSAAHDLLMRIADGMYRNGEPGIFNSTLASEDEVGDVRCTNPCGEIALEEWENCNLGHVNLAFVDNFDEAVECAELMAKWLIRATFSDGCSWRQRQVVDRNRRIGVGILGFQEWLWRRYNLTWDQGDDWQVKADLGSLSREVEQAAANYATDLGCSMPVKCTTVAPTGTVAKMTGTTEGIHPVYAKYFIRRVRYAEDHPEVERARSAGLKVEPDVVSDRTVVVEYPCKDTALDVIPDDKALESSDLTIGQMLNVQRAVQRSWADNAVSFTVNFSPERHTVRDVFKALATYGRDLKGTTMMPEGSYEQAPIERITREQYEAYGSTETSSSADDCATGACPVK